MVASIAAVTSAEGAHAYFLNSGAEQYFLGAGEPSGIWFGGGAQVLGLTGGVTSRVFRHLLAGLTPDGRGPLAVPRPKIAAPTGKKQASRRSATKTSNATRLPALDLTFSVPKSVSALWAASSPPLRKQIDEAILRAVRATLTLAEAELPLARRGKGGRGQETANVVAALFPHATSRAGEPQRHVHCLVMNAVLRADGSWCALNSRALFRWTRALGPLLRSQLAFELRGLGFECERAPSAPTERLKTFELQGVPQSLCQQWSSRSAAIKQAVLGNEATSRWSSVSSRAKQRATLSTRGSKEKLPPLAELVQQWRETARRAGLHPEHLQGTSLAPTPSPEASFEAAWQSTLARVTTDKAHFSQREVVRGIAELLEPCGLTAGWIFRQVKDALSRRQEIIALRNERGEGQYTTTEVWNLEAELLERAERLRIRVGPTLTKQQIDRVIDRNRKLSDDQRHAVRRVLGERGGLRLLAGVAGAGKSYALDAVRQGLERAGYRVIGGALAAVAKEELAAKAKIPSRTVASYLHHLEKQPKAAWRRAAQRGASELLEMLEGRNPVRVRLDAKTVLVLDEAGMIDTGTLNRLTKLLEPTGATLLLVGDDRQLPAIAGAAPFRTLRTKFPHAVLKENRRQQDPDDRTAVRDLREGQARAALENYAQRGRLVVGKNRADTIRRLVAQWAEVGGVRRPKECIIFTQTREEAVAINALCQTARRRAGRNSRLQQLSIDGTRYAKGDRILFHEALRTHGIENGYFGTIRRVDVLKRTVTVELDGPPRRWFAPATPRWKTIPARELKGEVISLGYAATAHKMQSRTTQHGFILLGGVMDSQEMLYVQASRGAASTRLFVDRHSLGKDAEDLVRQVERSAFKRLAHDLGKQRPRQQLAHELERRPEG
jgi:conjugative relaxase-like TrwC/TraI family protein